MMASCMGYATMASADVMPSVAGLLSSYGYEDGLQPSVIDITPDELILSSENIYDEYKELIKQFIVVYAPHLSEENMNEIKTGILDLEQRRKENMGQNERKTTDELSDLIDSWKMYMGDISMKKVTATDNESPDPVELHLMADSDGIERSTPYYAIVIPQEFYEEFGTPSQWYCFNLNDEKVEQGETCNTFETPIDYGTFHSSSETVEEEPVVQTIEHSSAKVADMTLANVSCKATENQAECGWTAVEGADNVDIFLWDWTDNKDKLIGTVKMKSEYFRYDLTFDGQQRLTFKPAGSNGGREVVFTFNAFRTQEVKENTEKVDIKTPTGPRENAAIILVLTALGYGIYRKLARRY